MRWPSLHLEQVFGQWSKHKGHWNLASEKMPVHFAFHSLQKLLFPHFFGKREPKSSRRIKPLENLKNPRQATPEADWCGFLPWSIRKPWQVWKACCCRGFLGATRGREIRIPRFIHQDMDLNMTYLNSSDFRLVMMTMAQSISTWTWIHVLKYMWPDGCCKVCRKT